MTNPDPTPTRHALPFRPAGFATLAEALDYAAQGETGCNFFNGSGELERALPYAELRHESLTLARRLAGLGLARNSFVALIADTTPDFIRFFFACQYAGLTPVPLPSAVNLGGHAAYVDQLRGMLKNCAAVAAMAPEAYIGYLREAADALDLRFCGTPAEFDTLPATDVALDPLAPGELAYIQYTSGSTRFPRGVQITQEAVLSNLSGIIRHGVGIGPQDRCFSWLPFYHDMGLVGLVLVPVAAQISVDYLPTRAFAMRPRLWLKIMSQTRATIAFSPTFGYELCARRLRPGDTGKFDLSAWRVAGVGAEMIRTESLTAFAEAAAGAGFSPNAFLACYGMAECSLAITFTPLDRGIVTDRIDAERLAERDEARPCTSATGSGKRRARDFVHCGLVLPDHRIEVRNARGRPLPDRRAGAIFVRGPSLMQGYLNSPEITAATLSADGWLDTGDVGYLVEGSLVITGRAKDLIIINGRNIWPQDLEHIAERQDGVRIGDALSFSIPAETGGERAVLALQCRETDDTRRTALVARLRHQVQVELGIDCHVELVGVHSLPRTSSGKLSRSRARADYLHSQGGARKPMARTA